MTLDISLFKLLISRINLFLSIYRKLPITGGVTRVGKSSCQWWISDTTNLFQSSLHAGSPSWASFEFQNLKYRSRTLFWFHRAFLTWISLTPTKCTCAFRWCKWYIGHVISKRKKHFCQFPFLFLNSNNKLTRSSSPSWKANSCSASSEITLPPYFGTLKFNTSFRKPHKA